MLHLHRELWAGRGTELWVILNGTCSLLLALVNVSDPSSLPGVPGLYCFNTDAKLSLFLFPRDLLCSSDSKESTGNAGDLCLISGWGRSPGEGTGHPRQCSCLENPMDRGAWQTTVHGVAKSWT